MGSALSSRSTNANRFTSNTSTLHTLTWNCEINKFDNVHTCEIVGEMADFLHDGVILNGITYKI